ncbi:hypothetical protein PROAA_610071 [Candidatus Propionivibrio aalborgensis]|uniref:Uncharacterized protein n=1 Tax=Candidatus Propionivibrio aalborgensis TaxID=1860101 RepID=A0A1A8Y194_9RHOO|nr:hypothetical protein PROAA_610071 [Candidatus Propionivibrio aalborgensis]
MKWGFLKAEVAARRLLPGMTFETTLLSAQGLSAGSIRSALEIVRQYENKHLFTTS